MNKHHRELMERISSLLSNVAWALESTRTKYVIGEDVAKMVELENSVTAIKGEIVKALNEVREGK